MKKSLCLILSCILFWTNPALAVVRISNMNDFAFGTWSGSGDLQLTDAVCIYDSAGGAANRRYFITLTGSGAGGAFTIASGANTLAYSAAFAGSNGVFTNMTAGVRVQFDGAHRTSNTCGGTTNAQIRISLTQANMLTVDNGSYSGILTVLLQP
ncbi:hypothetical protein JNK13_01295 [bacterium]|nr:hypothetical protein [bacterium]